LKDILIIGANGFLGRTITQKLILQNYNVDCLIHNNSQYIPTGCRIISNKIYSNEKKIYDAIYLLASHIPYSNMDIISNILLETNIEIPLNIVKQNIDSKIIYASSISIYGNCSGVINEMSPIKNPNVYGLSKFAAEIILKFHVNSCIIRYSSIYGVGMNTHTFIPQMVKMARLENQIEIWGDGTRKQDYINVSDAADLAISAYENDAIGVYVGSNGCSYSNYEIAKIIQSYTNCQIRYMGDDISQSIFTDNSKVKRDLNYIQKVSINDGIKQLIYG
jgi:UDP-glucose 4-epimerase